MRVHSLLRNLIKQRSKGQLMVMNHIIDIPQILYISIGNHKMPRVHTSQKQNKGAPESQKSKATSHTIVPNSFLFNSGQKIQEQRQAQKLRLKQAQIQKQSIKWQKKNRSVIQSVSGTHSQKPSINWSGAEQQQRNVLSVINKYLTLQQLKKHEQDLQGLMKIDGINNHAFVQKQKKQSIDIKDRAVNINNHLRIQFDRVEVQEEFKHIWGNCNIVHELQKINEQVSKLEHTINIPASALSTQQLKIIPNLTLYLNKILLTTNFLLSKICLNYQQTLGQVQLSRDLYEQLQKQLHLMHINRSQFLQTQQQTCQKESELYKQLNKLRSVMECYQKQNFQLRKEVNVLQDVIQEMNVQVEKAEKRLEEKRREYRVLQEQVRKMSVYVQQLEVQLTNEVSFKEQVNRLRQISDHQEQQIQKWKKRCFKQQQGRGSERKNISSS